MSKDRRNPSAMNNNELAAFCEQLAMILRSGISSYEGISIMMEDCESAEEKAVLEQILGGLNSGDQLADALEETGLFPEYMVNMIALGEETGHLDDVCAELNKHYEREAAIQTNIRDAITYPAVMIGMLIVVIGVILVKVMPVFDGVFRQLGGEMNGGAKLLMGIGSALSHYAVFFVIVLAIIIGGTVWAYKSENARAKLLSFAYRFKSIRAMMDGGNLCRLTGGMAIALASGCSPEKALELSAKLVSEANYSSKIEACRAAVDEGTDLCDALRDSGILSGLHARLAAVGRKTGSLEQSFGKISELCRADVDNALGSLLYSFEPAIVVVLSIIAGIILISVMLPLIGIMSII